MLRRPCTSIVGRAAGVVGVVRGIWSGGRRVVAPVLLVLLSAVTAAAQGGSGIAGVVKDTSGAVLPGVTVEAASPALIEKARTGVTDGSGLYRIVDLRPGVYTVTFTLPGFSTVKRDGIELTASFTATVNADLRVGALEETITVTGETSTVDVQNVVQQRVLTRSVIDAIPAGAKSIPALGVLIPGVVSNAQDVGGTAFSATAIAIHGSRFNEQQLLYDGVGYSHGGGSGGMFNTMVPNAATIQEVALEVGGTSAESPNGGLRTNVIPKEGGNTFSGNFFASFTNDALQADNLDDGLRQRGLTLAPQVDQIYDVNPAFGGPIARDRLWFWGSYRKQNSQQTVPGMFFNLTPGTPVYTPDPARPAYNNEEQANYSLRLTLQLDRRNKVSLQGQHGEQKRPYYGYACCSQFTTAPEANFYSESRPMYLVQAGWNAPWTSRLLLEAGAGGSSKNYHTYLQPGADPSQPSWLERSTGVRWGNYGGTYGHFGNFNFNGRVAGTYVTGRHAAKVGVSFQHTWFHQTWDTVSNGMPSWELLNGVPNRVQVFATPLSFDEVMKANIGVFVQDQWTAGRVTLNLGVRYDYYNAYVPAQSLSSGPQVPGREVTFPAVENVPVWKDWSPRLGLSWDLFGTGRTAVKVTANRYVESPNLITFTRAANPVGAIVSSTFRTWGDANRDFVPQAEELGPLQNVNFGRSVVTTKYADDVLRERGYNWEYSASLQHELLPRVSATVAYFRRVYGNLTVTDNLARTPADYAPYSITAPRDPRLPGGGGFVVIGLYDAVPSKAFLTDNLITSANHYGGREDVYDGIDVNLMARMLDGIILQGGVSIGRERIDNCSIVDSPQEMLHCAVNPPFQPNVKLLGVYPLPFWGLHTSATFQGLPGPQVLANYVVTNEQALPTLGRNLSASTATIPLIAPGTMYDERLYQLDLRFAKTIRFGERRIQGIVDIYNALNGNAVLALNNSFGPSWQRPTQVLQARLFKFGVQVDF